MAKETIMLNCAAGMSTSVLVKKMQDEAKAQGRDTEIFACSASEADQKLDTMKIDVVLLGPQVAYMRAYGMMDGKTVLAQADKLMGK